MDAEANGIALLVKIFSDKRLFVHFLRLRSAATEQQVAVAILDAVKTAIGLGIAEPASVAEELGGWKGGWLALRDAIASAIAPT